MAASNQLNQPPHPFGSKEYTSPVFPLWRLLLFEFKSAPEQYKGYGAESILVSTTGLLELAKLRGLAFVQEPDPGSDGLDQLRGWLEDELKKEANKYAGGMQGVLLAWAIKAYNTARRAVSNNRGLSGISKKKLGGYTLDAIAMKLIGDQLPRAKSTEKLLERLKPLVLDPWEKAENSLSALLRA